MEKLTYSYEEAAAASGYSVDTIKRAVGKGDLPTVRATVDGRHVAKPVIPAAALRAWLSLPKEAA